MDRKTNLSSSDAFPLRLSGSSPDTFLNRNEAILMGCFPLPTTSLGMLMSASSNVCSMGASGMVVSDSFTVTLSTSEGKRRREGEKKNKRERETQSLAMPTIRP